MADWLSEFEEQKKQKEERERRDREESRRKREEDMRNSPQLVGYRRNKDVINEIQQKIIQQVNRANQVGGFGITTSTPGGWSFHIDKPNPEPSKDFENLRTLDIASHLDDFEVIILAFGKDETGGYHKFMLPIRSVTDQHVSDWVRWIATGEGLSAIVPKRSLFSRLFNKSK